MASEVSWFWFQSQFKKDYRKTIETIDDNDLSPLNKMLLRKRFIPILKTMELEMKRVSTGFTLFQLITTLGSIVVPALLSIEDRSLLFNSTYSDIELQTHNLYWTTWAISISVTISNAFNQLLGLEKKYIIRNIHLSQMKKEGWSFLEKSGNIYGKTQSKTRNELINIFWKRVETLRHNQIKNDLSFDNTDDLINNNPEMIETLNAETYNFDSETADSSIPESVEETLV
jgi:hypothetical protein